MPRVPLILPNPSPNQCINPAAFVRQPTGFGDGGRNILTGPGFADVDLSIAKDTKITERVSLHYVERDSWVPLIAIDPRLDSLDSEGASRISFAGCVWARDAAFSANAGAWQVQVLNKTRPTSTRWR